MSKTITYAYDGFGRKTSFAYPTRSLQGSDALTLRFSYDAIGRLRSIMIPGQGEVSFVPDADGQNKQVILPGGAQKSFDYDLMSVLVTNTAVDPAGNPLLCRAYSRNLAGNILAQNTEQGNYDYDYDLIDQLTNVNIIAYTGPVGAATNEGFAYDPMGNRVASSSAITNLVGGALRAASYSVNSLNQYSEISNTESQITLQYDLNGNLTNRASATETNIYTWDIENRLVSFQRLSSNGTINAQYAYDPFGRRLMKNVSNPSGSSYTNYYLYADEGLIAECDGEGNLTLEYGYTPGSMWMNNLVFMRTHGQTTNCYYAINDHLGALQKLVANNGSVVWSMAQDAFGQAVVSSNSTIICNLRFSSQYYDEEKGSHNNTMRDYDPISGRYLSKDPVGERAVLNLFLFVGNNALLHVDEYGEDNNTMHAQILTINSYSLSQIENQSQIVTQIPYTPGYLNYSILQGNAGFGANAVPAILSSTVFPAHTTQNSFGWSGIFYGHYCGPGTRPLGYTGAPIDLIDAACQRHDKCYENNRIPTWYADPSKTCGKRNCDTIFINQLKEYKFSVLTSVEAYYYANFATELFSDLGGGKPPSQWEKCHCAEYRPTISSR